MSPVREWLQRECACEQLMSVLLPGVDTELEKAYNVYIYVCEVWVGAGGSFFYI